MHYLTRLRCGFRGCSLLALFTLAGCASTFDRAEDLALQEQWTQAIIEYRKAYNKDPSNVLYKSRLKQAELRAADHHYQRGARLLDQGNVDGAVVEFQQGLVAMPDHSKLLQGMSEAMARKEGIAVYQEAARLQEAGKDTDAKQQLERALEIYPGHKEAASALARIKQREDKELSEKLVLASRTPITLNFRQTDLKTAFEFIGKSFGINIIFDDSIKSVPVTLFVKDVTFEQALQLMIATTKTFYKEISANTILVASDTKEKRGQYEDNILRTFYLNSIKAKEMGDILKGVITIKKLIINEQNNSIVVRDTEEVLSLVEKIIVTNDRKPAEIWLEVEILEVSRTKTEQLGLNFGQQLKVDYPTTNVSGSWRNAYRAGTVTLPPTILNLFKKDVDAKILANPKVRTINGKPAKIHIGDRVPLRNASTQDGLGVIRTTYQYTDVGIKLTVEPTVNLDNSATVKVNLEVSSLGQNLGTPQEPAYSIGTRNAESIMVLRDGETAILGGLINDEDRKNRVRVPGLGDVPALGALFTNFDNEVKRTDVLLTITPRVVRGWDIPAKAQREFYSGTESLYLDKPLFAKLNGPMALKSPVTPPDGATQTTSTSAMQSAPATAAPPTSASTVASATPATPPPAEKSSVVTFGFSEGVYESAVDQEFEIRIVGGNLANVTSVPLEILYNPQLLGFVRGEAGDLATKSFSASGDATRGILQVDIGIDPSDGKIDGNLARLVLRGAKPGISYLVYRVPVLKSNAGETISAQVRASRVVIK